MIPFIIRFFKTIHNSSFKLSPTLHCDREKVERYMLLSSYVFFEKHNF